MMKILLAFVFVSQLYISFSFGQTQEIKDYRYKIGVPYEKNISEYSYFANQGDEVLSLKVKGKTIVLQKYDDCSF